MTASKATTRRDSKQIPAAPSRTASYARVRTPPRGQGAADEDAVPPPSSLPPPPFLNEGDVPGLEWWLDAHMGIAGQLAWLEQLFDGGGSAGTATVRSLVSQAEEVRDALYELYCDAADSRLAPLVAPGGHLERQVSGSYRWCALVVDVLASLTTGLRAASGPDWGAIKVGFRQAAEHYTPPSDPLRAAVHELPIDTTSPVEPLRYLSRDLETLFAATEDLHAALAPRLA